MCGINGIVAYNSAASAPRPDELLRTRDHMAARGPDGMGAWWSDDRRTGLGHRRLSIIDLSERGAQPMASADQRFVIVFNGEIYNYRELRSELEKGGARFHSTSDTEVILHLFARHGSATAAMLRGMFALAIWDVEERRLYLARDPYGIKPLYVSDDGWTFRFASQVKALLAGGGISRDADPAGLAGFLLWGSVPEPFTCYRDIRAVPAGHYQYVDEAGARAPQRYASIAGAFRDAASPGAISGQSIAAQVREAVLDSVRAHLVADVEVGLFLSAGIDSGALLGLMRDAGQAHVRGLTLRFPEYAGTSEDEAPLAREVAEYYGADHAIRDVSPAEFRDDLPAIVEAMDQPSIDGVNSWFAAKFAKELGLKVVLSGVGGDELFGGYPSFTEIPRLVSSLAIPSRVPGLAAAFGWSVRALDPGGRSPKLAELLRYGGSYAGAYLLRRAVYLPAELRGFLSPEALATGLARLDPLAALRETLSRTSRDAHARIASLESEHYMRHQLLRDSDWAGMAHGIEVRTPLVDYQLLRELAPLASRIRGQRGKEALAAAPAKPLGPAIVHRPKTGFGVPTGNWIERATTHTAASKGAASRAWAGEIFAGLCPEAFRPSAG